MVISLSFLFVEAPGGTNGGLGPVKTAVIFIAAIAVVFLVIACLYAIKQRIKGKKKR